MRRRETILALWAFLLSKVNTGFRWSMQWRRILKWLAGKSVQLGYLAFAFALSLKLACLLFARGPAWVPSFASDLIRCSSRFLCLGLAVLAVGALLGLVRRLFRAVLGRFLAWAVARALAGNGVPISWQALFELACPVVPLKDSDDAAVILFHAFRLSVLAADHGVSVDARLTELTRVLKGSTTPKTFHLAAVPCSLNSEVRKCLAEQALWLDQFTPGGGYRVSRVRVCDGSGPLPGNVIEAVAALVPVLSAKTEAGA